MPSPAATIESQAAQQQSLQQPSALVITTESEEVKIPDKFVTASEQFPMGVDIVTVNPKNPVAEYTKMVSTAASQQPQPKSLEAVAVEWTKGWCAEVIAIAKVDPQTAQELDAWKRAHAELTALSAAKVEAEYQLLVHRVKVAAVAKAVYKRMGKEEFDKVVAVSIACDDAENKRLQEESQAAKARSSGDPVPEQPDVPVTVESAQKSGGKPWTPEAQDMAERWASAYPTASWESTDEQVAALRIANAAALVAH